jgi:hypothetical protein
MQSGGHYIRRAQHCTSAHPCVACFTARARAPPCPAARLSPRALLLPPSFPALQADWDPELVRKANRETASAVLAGRAATTNTVTRIVKAVDPPK